MATDQARPQYQGNARSENRIRYGQQRRQSNRESRRDGRPFACTGPLPAAGLERWSSPAASSLPDGLVGTVGLADGSARRPIFGRE